MAAGTYSSIINATTGTGTTVDFGYPTASVMFEILVTGTVTAGTVAMEVSIDGTNWFRPPTSVIQNFSGATQANPYVLVSNTNALFDIGTVNAPIRYARGNIVANVTGGATVSVNISGN